MTVKINSLVVAPDGRTGRVGMIMGDTARVHFSSSGMTHRSQWVADVKLVDLRGAVR
jgi:hypothetical protein